MQLTYFGANAWQIDLGDRTLLIDPWLVGSLTFGNAKWLFEGKHRVAPTIPDRIDLILLSQGLEDHAHRPTLTHLDRQIPVVGSPTAIQVAQTLGYQNLTTLKPGETHQIGDWLSIQALAGAPVPQIENGYILTDLKQNKRLYYEPHGFSPADIAQYAPVETIITPIVTLGLPLIGPIIKGNANTVTLARSLQAKYVLPTAAGGDIEYSGILDRFLQIEGSPEAFRQQLQAAGLATELLDPKPLVKCEV